VGDLGQYPHNQRSLFTLYDTVIISLTKTALQTIIMKTLQLLFLLLFFPLVFHAQQTLTGLWIGSLSNDSTTVRNDQSYEIALTQYKEKVYGYSRSSFIVNDTLYYVLKRVKGKIEGDVCEIKDDEIVSYNFPGRLDKGVKVTTTFRRNLVDSTWHLSGDWKTNKTKKFYAVTGKVELKSEANYDKSKIFPHLEELTMDKDVEFYMASKKPVESKPQPKDIAAIAKKEVPVKNTQQEAGNKKDETKKSSDSDVAKTATNKTDTPAIAVSAKQNKEIPSEVKETTITKQEPVVKKEEPVSEEIATSTPTKKSDLPATTIQAEQKKDIAGNLSKPEVKKQELLVNKEESVHEEIATSTATKKSDLPATTIQAEQKKDIAGNLSKPEVKKQELPVKKEEPVLSSTTDVAKTTTKKSELVTTAKAPEEKKLITEATKPSNIKITSTAAAFIAERKTVAPQIVTFKSDSLELALYDNGEIDGDTVSVLLNGEIFMAKQGLKASAIKKTIYIQPGTEEVTLVLYAENLGKYPPNTGLLVVHDGEDVYQVRFSADLQQNAAVVFRRKK